MFGLVRKSSYRTLQSALKAEQALNLEVAGRAVTEVFNSFPQIETALLRSGVDSWMIKNHIERWLSSAYEEFISL